MTILEKIQTVLSKHGITGIKLAAEPEVKLLTAELENGGTIQTPAEAWAEGVEVSQVDADGNTAPLPDGEYALKSGEVVVVKEGKVSEIKAKEEAPAEPTAEEMAEALTALSQKLDEVTSELNAAKTELEKANTELSAAKTRNAELSESVTKLSKKAVPSSKDIKSTTEPAPVKLGQKNTAADNILARIQNKNSAK